MGMGKRLGEAREAFGGVLRNGALLRLELAWAFSIIAAWAYGIAVVVYAYEQGGARAVGIVGLVRWGAAAVVSPFAAVLGDRHDRRRVMVASDLVRAGLIVGAAAAVFTSVAPALVYVLAGLVSVAGTPFRPAEAAYTPTLAETPEELSAANVVAAAIESVGIFAGPALGGYLTPGRPSRPTPPARCYLAPRSSGCWQLVRSRARKPWRPAIPGRRWSRVCGTCATTA
jgi:MFS family permease